MILALPSLAACSSGGDESKRPPAEQERVFSDADKAAARALSTGDRLTVEGAGSDYEQALLCRHSVHSLVEFVEKTEGLTDQQVQSADQLKAYSDQQLELLASENGRSAADIRGDLERVAGEHQDTAENMRIALACLQRFQNRT